MVPLGLNITTTGTVAGRLGVSGSSNRNNPKQVARSVCVHNPMPNFGHIVAVCIMKTSRQWQSEDRNLPIQNPVRALMDAEKLYTGSWLNGAAAESAVDSESIENLRMMKWTIQNGSLNATISAMWVFCERMGDNIGLQRSQFGRNYGKSRHCA